MEASCGPGDGERARLPGVDSDGGDGTYCPVLITLCGRTLTTLGMLPRGESLQPVDRPK